MADLIRGLLCLLLTVALAGCSLKDGLPDDERTAEADRQVRQKWGKPLSELPTLTLEIVSPHNENIRNEYQWAFSLHYALEHGKRVRFEWRDIGGSGDIQSYLENVRKFGGKQDIDLLWGGGDYVFTPLAKRGHLERMEIAPDVLANVPARLDGVALYDPNHLWFGAALSAFGFVYNRGLLERCGKPLPEVWADLADPNLADLLILGDPTRSGSVAASYLMVVQSAESWPEGWSKLLGILANAKRFTPDAGTAASAPLLGEGLVATCIDFYGAMRVAEAPDQIVYVSPRGETAFTPDPIAILKDAPHRELAQQFVDFVLSPEGQKLWALRVGENSGPVRNVLGRTPIRRDVFEKHAQQMVPGIVNPYEAGRNLPLSGFRGKVDYTVLRNLVKAAAIDNAAGLREARDALIACGRRPDLLAELYRLPGPECTPEAGDLPGLTCDLSTIEGVQAVKAQFRDKQSGDRRKERIVTAWQDFYRQKYRRIVEASRE